jgi:hypothetical protein
MFIIPYNNHYREGIFEKIGKLISDEIEYEKYINEINNLPNNVMSNFSYENYNKNYICKLQKQIVGLNIELNEYIDKYNELSKYNKYIISSKLIKNSNFFTIYTQNKELLIELEEKTNQLELILYRVNELYNKNTY